ncbi:MAG: hypothetical protein DBX91_05070 [Subdoligranulum variabile]|nr:MAG: hypothetical protein DBX91_05070 [Subdoligranulum variabile]
MKCSFCGGNVVDGRCQDCGMPYATERRYTLRSEGEGEHPAGQEAEKPRRRAPVYDRPPVKRAQRPPRPAAQPQRKANAAKRSSAGIIVWMVLAVLAVQLIPMLFASCSA